jgi:ABC-2 type transport system permease protein
MTRFRTIRLVTRRELLERGRSRAFIVSVVISIAIVVGAVFLPSLIGQTAPQHLGIVGTAPAGLVDTLQVGAKQADLVVIVDPVPDEATAEARLKDGTLDAALVIPADGSTPTWLVKSRGNALLQSIVVGSFTPPPQIALRALEPPDPGRDTAFVFANVGVILLFIAIFTFGTWVLTGVVEEKQSRVVEVVLATMDPRDLLIGKVLGIGLLGIVQLTAMVGVGIGLGIALNRFTLPASTPGAVAMLLLWFVLGYAFYATALAVLGALASRQEEASNAASPVSILATVAYLFALIVALNDPSGTAARIASFIPPVAPMVVPLRAALGAIEPWEIALSATVMVISIWFLFVLGGRVYSGAVLQTGARMRLRDAWRASERG